MESAGLTAPHTRPPVLLRLFRFLRPRDGYLVFLLAWAAVITLPAAALLGGSFAGAEPLLWLATLSFVAARWLAARKVNGWVAVALCMTSGALAVLLWGVHVLRPWPLLSQSGRWFAWWLGKHPDPAPQVTALAEQAASLAGFAQRVAWWT